MGDMTPGAYPGMGPSKGASQPAVLALNPHNREASAARRAKLLAAFDSLDVNARADLLETAEHWATTGFADPDKTEARGIFRQMYAAAGWEQ